MYRSNARIKQADVDLELLLGDISSCGFQQLQDTWSNVSAAEVICAQCCEQHILGLAADLRGKKGLMVK